MFFGARIIRYSSVFDLRFKDPVFIQSLKPNFIQNVAYLRHFTRGVMQVDSVQAATCNEFNEQRLQWEVLALNEGRSDASVALTITLHWMWSKLLSFISSQSCFSQSTVLCVLTCSCSNCTQCFITCMKYCSSECCVFTAAFSLLSIHTNKSVCRCWTTTAAAVTCFEQFNENSSPSCSSFSKLFLISLELLPARESLVSLHFYENQLAERRLGTFKVTENSSLVHVRSSSISEVQSCVVVWCVGRKAKASQRKGDACVVILQVFMHQSQCKYIITRWYEAPDCIFLFFCTQVNFFFCTGYGNNITTSGLLGSIIW